MHKHESPAVRCKTKEQLGRVSGWFCEFSQDGSYGLAAAGRTAYSFEVSHRYCLPFSWFLLRLVEVDISKDPSAHCLLLIIAQCGIMPDFVVSVNLVYQSWFLFSHKSFQFLVFRNQPSF